MPESEDWTWNAGIIGEFRANEGRLRGYCEGWPVVLVHPRGRKSGQHYVNPLVCLPDDSDEHTIYVMASKGGAPSNPDWYYNLPPCLHLMRQVERRN